MDRVLTKYYDDSNFYFIIMLVKCICVNINLENDSWNFTVVEWKDNMIYIAPLIVIVLLPVCNSYNLDK